ncbi:MAG: hypothetical protein DRP61_02080 [Candidatus Omnitrophota bacterium]|nr:MAG: hypothetical protein DRP61_02080 [Candidatus Omnitrophota bacterium]RKY34214.1 MAG: hypothetical protein DRP69_05245 [Candidatus Omnitrophota bacterium]RKY43182.1 MAG: hypothetical protein DRP80_05915 [Candidatus Omnitrophota bacterium]
MLKGNNKKTFTLLELILSLGIASLILAVLITGFNLSFKVYKKVRETQVFNLAEFLDKLSSDFLSAYLPLEDEVFRFKADNTSLEFVRVAPFRVNLRREENSDLRRVSYYLTLQEDGNYILFRVEKDFFSVGKEVKEKILSSLKNLEFSYFDGKGWRNNWDSVKKLPSALKISVRLREENKVFSTVIERF